MGSWVTSAAVVVLAATLAVSCTPRAEGRASESIVSSKAAGSCPDCQDGEYAIRMTQKVTHGDYVLVADPPCVQTYKGRLKEAADVLAGIFAKSSYGKALGPFAGPLSKMLATKGAEELEKELREKAAGSIAALIAPIIGEKTANCYTLAGKVPIGSSGIRHSWKARGVPPNIPDCGNGDPAGCACDSDSTACQLCNDAGDCAIGWCGWKDFTYDAKTGVVSALFRNWSGDRDREAELTVYFKPPSGWTP